MSTFKRVLRWIKETCLEIERLQKEMIEQQITIITKPKRDSKGRFCK